MRRTLLLISLLAAAGCAGPRQSIRIDPRYLAPDGQPYSDRDLATVLRQHVEGGQVRYARLVADHEPLERFLGLIGKVGPTTQPAQFASAPERVCYYVNAYNACALRAVVAAYPAYTVHTLDLPLEHGPRFLVDGREASLGQLRDAALEAAGGDARVLFCLCAAALGTPRLSGEPLRPDDLEGQIATAVEEGVLNPHLVRIDHAERAVFLWDDLLRHRDAFLAQAHRRGASAADVVQALAALTGGAAREHLLQATSCTIRIMPFDRRLNDLPDSVLTAAPRPAGE